MTFLKAALCVASITLLSGHVAPSVDDNNRYLKVTPLRDGFRLAYTVFFGEIPGAAERRKLDANRDSRVDEGEAQRFADKLAREVGDAIDIETDGVPQRVQWLVVSPGLGTDAVAAGSFSIDFIGFICVPGRVGTRHKVRLRDHFRLPKPGETEVKVEDSPGVTIHRARVGAADDPTHNFRFVGPGGPVSEDGLELDFTSTESASIVPNARCLPPSGDSRDADDGGWFGRNPLTAGLAIALALAVGFIATWLRRRRS